MTNLSLEQLAAVVGGDAFQDGINAAKRSRDLKPGHGSADIFGYQNKSGTTTTTGIGGEIRQQISPNASIFINGHVGTANDKPDTGVMGGISFSW